MSRSDRLFSVSLAVQFALLGATLPEATGQWVEFVDETATRLPTPLNDPALSTTDPEEKDYAWGDVDQDGDVDLVVVRKEPFTTTGRRINVLFMNEGIAEGHVIDGVLVDRTAQYASESDTIQAQGFLTPTNDRDVVLHDVDNDGWLDMVTATTLTDNQPAHLSHPRVYINKGELAGVWQGFRYEESRIPVMHPTAGPRFCSVSAGDVNGDGYADLYFADYDNGVTGDPVQLFDFNNRLLINGGPANPGVFTDETDSRLTPQMSYSEFGTSSFIADINGDGRNDIGKNSSLVAPYHVAVTYNSPTNEGEFDDGGAYETVFTLAPYFTNVGDLNGDGRLDIVITDDAADRYLLNQGNGPNGLATWIQYVFPGSEGFGGNSTIADLDGDGFDDVIITDVDVDVQGCGGRTFIMHNLADVPEVSFLEHDQVIPDLQLLGVHDAAVFDLDGDGFNDVVLGRCGGTQVWMNQPPAGLVFTYSEPLPDLFLPDVVTEIDVVVTGFGAGSPAPGTGRQFVSIDGGAFAESAMQDLGGGQYRATLPALPCPSTVRFYFSADMAEGGTEFDPPAAPAGPYVTLVGAASVIAIRDEIEGDVSSWTVENQALAGAWEQADPNGTIFGGGTLAAPDADATADPGTMAFVTENGLPGGNATVADVDGGPTRLVSPVIDVAGGDAVITYARWFFCDNAQSPSADFLTVDLSNGGGNTWTPVPDHTTGGTGGEWEVVSLIVSDHIAPTADMRIRFSTADQPNDSVTEAGIDDFQVDVIECVACAADLDGSGDVGVTDLLQVLGVWGACPGCPEDIDGDGAVAVGDLLTVLATWGPCG